MKYEEYYKLRPERLESGSNITVISLPGMADARFLDYVHYRVTTDETPYQSIIINANELIEDQIEPEVQKSKSPKRKF